MPDLVLRPAHIYDSVFDGVDFFLCVSDVVKRLERLALPRLRVIAVLHDDPDFLSRDERRWTQIESA